MSDSDRPELTDTQRRILNFIEKHIAKYHYPPTYNEIGKAAGLHSTGSVDYQIKELENKGYIAVKRGTFRAIQVLHSATD
jgi:SOS-response transcriptional repressor LexA